MSRSVQGTGTLDIQAQAALSLTGAATGQLADFLATTGLLDLNSPAAFHGLIAGFGGADAIDLIATAATGETFSQGVLSIDNGSKVVASLRLEGSYTTSDFHLSNDGLGGTMITFS
jgi:hypothetical protein